MTFEFHTEKNEEKTKDYYMIRDVNTQEWLIYDKGDNYRYWVDPNDPNIGDGWEPTNFRSQKNAEKFLHKFQPVDRKYRTLEIVYAQKLLTKIDKITISAHTVATFQPVETEDD